jgi:hypothetical protein
MRTEVQSLFEPELLDLSNVSLPNELGNYKKARLPYQVIYRSPESLIFQRQDQKKLAKKPKSVKL